MKPEDCSNYADNFSSCSSTMTFWLHMVAMHHCLSSPMYMHIHKAFAVFRVFQKVCFKLIPFAWS